MTQVGVTTLQAKLSHYLRRASEGERIIVTDSGRPLAALTAVDESPAARHAWALVEAGLASWSGGNPKGSARPPKIKGKTTAEIVLEDRR